MDDLIFAYRAATDAQAAAQKRVDALGAERARILAELHASGRSYRALARDLGVSPGLVQKLVERHRAQ